MAEVSGLSHALLRATARDFLRLETLHAAHDAIRNATAARSAFRLFDIQHAIHSSSDGQRLETQIHTIHARHSPNYFGLQKGVSSYTLVANHVPVNAKILGTQEQESHDGFDVLYNHSSEIKPERHSTDTHGTNHVNFWILHAFGYRFAPRYRDLKKKTATRIGFQHPRGYGDFLSRPSRKAFDDLMIKEMVPHPAHHGVAGAPGRDPGHHRAQAQQLRAAEPNQESLVGTRQCLPDALYPRFHR